MPSTSFRRGLTVCDVHPSPDGWEWLSYVSVDAVHPFHGRTFVVLKCRHTLTHVAHQTGDASHDSRWWFVIDSNGCPDEDAALRKLMAAGDEMTHDP